MPGKKSTYYKFMKPKLLVTLLAVFIVSISSGQTKKTVIDYLQVPGPIG